MDSKDVSRAIRSQIRPMLQSNGFSDFTSRSCWRYVGARIDVVNFQSFNSCHAEGIGCTTFSFAINLGCMFSDIPSSLGQERLKVKDGRLRPEEYECTLRERLERGYRHKLFRDRREIWFIDADGGNLDRAITDACDVIESAGLSWFERFPDHRAVLEMLKRGEPEGSGVSGLGAAGSPIHNYYLGYFALAEGQPEVAGPALGAALDSGCFDSLKPELQSAIERAV